MKRLIDEFKRFKGQPIEVITESGFKVCGIECDFDDESVTIIDRKNRVVVVLDNHIETIVEPQMKLDRICKNNDCDCECDCDCRKRSSHGENDCD